MLVGVRGVAAAAAAAVALSGAAAGKELEMVC